MKILIRHGRVVDPASGRDETADVAIASGRVVGIGTAAASASDFASDFAADRVIDATGLVVAPGLVDLAARLREPGQEHEGMLESELAAAAAGGVTSLVCPPDTDPVIDETGLVLTNLHTIDGGEVGPAPAAGDAGFKIYVRLSDRRVFQAEVVAADPRVDLAVLRLPKDSYPHLKVTAGPVPRKGQIVLALGNPYAIARDGSASASWGIVGNITRRVPLERELGMAERMQKEVMS
ncbi:MAG: trypsin-like peptidase domain-containing protein, partial [Betaproteobacteria bacterium]